MQKLFLIAATLLILTLSTTLSAQEGYEDDSSTTPPESEEIGSNETDETPEFPSITKFIATQLYAKPDFEVVGVETSLGHEVRPAFQVVIPNVETDDALKAWEKLMKSYGADVEETEAIIVAENARIKDISSKPLNIYAKAQQKIEGSGIVAIFETDKDEYVGDDLKMNGGIELLMSNFATTFAKEDAEERLKSVEKSLKGLESLLDKLKRQNENYRKDIIRSKGGIAESKSAIDMAKQKQELTETVIEAHEESEAYLDDEMAAKELKKQNKELKKIEKTKKRSSKNIDKEQQDILENEQNIEENERQQKMIQEAIMNQRQEVKNAQKYLKLFE